MISKHVGHGSETGQSHITSGQSGHGSIAGHSGQTTGSGSGFLQFFLQLHPQHDFFGSLPYSPKVTPLVLSQTSPYPFH